MPEIISTKAQIDKLSSLDNLNLSEIKSEMRYDDFIKYESNLYSAIRLMNLAEIASALIDIYTTVLHNTDKAPEFVTASWSDDNRYLLLTDAYDADGKWLMECTEDPIHFAPGVNLGDVDEMFGEYNPNNEEPELHISHARDFFTKFFPND